MSWLTVAWPVIAGACLTLVAMHRLGTEHGVDGIHSLLDARKAAAASRDKPVPETISG